MRKAQVSVFVIVAIVIAIGIILFFLLQSNFGFEKIPTEFQGIYENYKSCIQLETENAISIIQTQGGYINLDDYKPGSNFAPSGNHLNFLGNSIPYWFYISGNNIANLNIPTRSSMELEIETYISTNLNEKCNFDKYYEQGFNINFENEPEIQVLIQDNEVGVKINSQITLSKEDRSARKTQHEIKIQSKLGSFHTTAREIITKELDEQFLEKYALDALQSYAPVDGVVVQCAPLIWKSNDVVNELKEGLAANIGAIKFLGNYYTPNEKTDEYFKVKQEVNNAVNLIYSPTWPTKIEITPADDTLMIAQPVGNEQGLGVLGFCYVPYHFVYDLTFPVMIQIHDGLEIFQFPTVVTIIKNQIGETSLISIPEDTRIDLCSYKDGSATINTFDNNLNPLEAQIQYKCFDTTCTLGNTIIDDTTASITTAIPLCVNGQLITTAEGYAKNTQIYSSNSETIADIILEKEYSLPIELRVGGKILTNEIAIINIEKEDGQKNTIILPENKNITLTEGEYTITVSVYGSISITIPANTKTQCVNVIREGIAGFFGSSKEECFDTTIPETKLETSLIGGGSSTTYILESQLQNEKLLINVNSLPTPTTLEQLQYNYEAHTQSSVILTYI